MNEFHQRTVVAIAWCLAWESNLNPDHDAQALRAAVNDNQPLATPSLQSALEKATTLANLSDSNAFKTQANLEQWIADHSELWESRIGLVYGGATKIKSYVFESADLQEIRGASALLDRINLVDLPAFFRGETTDDFPQCQQGQSYCRQIRSQWLKENFPVLETALIPELIIYSTGGNILALCPAELVDDLANAIEKRYTAETLTANSCAVGAKFRAPEIYAGLQPNLAGNSVWHDTITSTSHRQNPAVQAYFGFKHNTKAGEITQAFNQRQGFSELTGRLASLFNQRRSGHDNSARPSRCYPPMFETHPYLMRDDSDRRSAVVKVPASQLPNEPKLSEPTARKRIVGQVAKREGFSGSWYLGKKSKFRQTVNGQKYLWKPGPVSSWVNKFEQFLISSQLVSTYDSKFDIFRTQFTAQRPVQTPFKHEARSLHEIGDASDGFVAYIYADGNNMGQYIRDQIKTPEQYRQFSQDIFEATEESVYWALAHCIAPHYYTPDARSSRNNKDPVWIHPFEIITIGGDDVLLVVPANKALEVAEKIGTRFEEILKQKLKDDGKKRYGLDPKAMEQSKQCHRYTQETSAPASECCLSISSGVLITAVDTPIYYADKLVSQLLKSAKKKAKDLKGKGYHGGTVDFLTLKAVTMISSNINDFRSEGLTVRFPERSQQLKLYAAPYTLYELQGLIKTVQSVKKSGFPKSQLYQIRSLLERGKRTAILNYRYFRVRLADKEQHLLQTDFEAAWCDAETNNGNLAPWLTATRKDGTTTYETLWRELVELYPFIKVPEAEATPSSQTASTGEDQS